MIQAFSKSRRLALAGGIVFGALAAAAAWWLLANRVGGLGNRLLVTALAAFVAVNIVLYAARILAMREYQTRLLYLYEELDPEKFLKALLPLQKAKMDASNRCTTLVHIANGYLYAGQPDQALEVLAQVNAPEKALEMRGLVLGNQATVYLAQNNADRAQKAMDDLRRIAGAKQCKKEFALKARHTLGYLQLCLDIARGKKVDTAVLEQDFETSRAPLHRLDVQYRLALAYRRAKNQEGYERAKSYVTEQGGKTCFAKLL